MEQIQNIIVPTDFSQLSEAAAARAATIARSEGASIHLIHAARNSMVAAPYDVSLPPAVWEVVRRTAHEKLEEARKAIETKGVSTVTAEVTESGDTIDAIVAVVEAKEADLVVMGTHGRGGIKHAFLGSVAERTLRTVDCPVLVVKEDPKKAEEPITRILAAVDFSVHSDRAVEVAEALAERLSASVDVVHAFELPGDYIPYTAPFGMELEEKIEASAGENLKTTSERLRRSQSSVTLHSRRGRPSIVIAETAKEVDCQLIVMGTRGNTGLSHVLLGSVAERTIRTAPCSVLAVKSDEPHGDA